MKVQDANSGDGVLVAVWFKVSRHRKESGDLLARLARHVNGRLVEDNAFGREWYLPPDAEVLEHIPHKPAQDEGAGEDPLG